jgi:hypothetical protein
MRGATGEPDAGTLPPPPSDARAAPEVASGIDASNVPPVDSGGSSDGGDSLDATPVSCAVLPAGIFPPSGATCQLVDPQPGQAFCVADAWGHDGPMYMEFVGCFHGTPATMESVCSNGMCCQRLSTSFFSTPGYVCAIAAGMQIIAYGDPIDTDQDFIPDYRDTCPYVANFFDQFDDDDGDGIANACDPCPEVPGVTCANPGTP